MAQQVEIRLIEQVLSSQQLINDIPNYINGRSAQNNLKLIKTAIWVFVNNIMDAEEIHKTLLAFETTVKRLNSETVALSEKVVNKILRSNGKVIPSSLFKMWCKRCWQYLETSKIQTGLAGQQKESEKEKAKKQRDSDSPDLHSSDDENPLVQTYEEFKDFSLSPQEFLSLACNARNRQDLISKVYKPCFKMRKQEYINNIPTTRNTILSDKRMVMYEMTEQDIKGDCRINLLIQQQLEEDFYDNLPLKSEGQALPMKEAGIYANRIEKQIVAVNNQQKGEPLESQIKVSNLKDSIKSARSFGLQMRSQGKEFFTDVYKKRQLKFKRTGGGRKNRDEGPGFSSPKKPAKINTSKDRSMMKYDVLSKSQEKEDLDSLKSLTTNVFVTEGVENAAGKQASRCSQSSRSAESSFQSD